MLIYSNTLKTNLQKNLADAYLIVNENPGLQAEERDLVKKAFNYEVKHFFYMDQHFKVQDVEAIINEGNLFGTSDMIELLLPGDLTKTSATTILDLTTRAVDNKIKVLASCYKTKYAQAWHKKLEECMTVVRSKSITDMNVWIKQRARKLNLKINAEVINHLAHRTDNNADMAAQELEKLRIIYGTKDEISFAKINEKIEQQNLDSIFTFKTYLLTGKTKQMLRAIKYLKETKEQPTLVVWMLAEIAKAIKINNEKSLPFLLKFDKDFPAVMRRGDKVLIKDLISAISQADLISKGMSTKQDPWVYITRIAFAFSMYVRNNKFPKYLLNE